MNDKNLISLADRPIEERRRIARMGGIASGVSRRKRASWRRSFRAQMIRENLKDDIEAYVEDFDIDLDSALDDLFGDFDF